MQRADFLEVSSDHDFVVLVCSTKEAHYLVTFSFDGHFDFISKIKLQNPLVAFSKFRMENVFMAAEKTQVIIYHIDGKNFFRLATESIASPGGILSAVIAQNDKSIFALTNSGNQLVIL